MRGGRRRPVDVRRPCARPDAGAGARRAEGDAAEGAAGAPPCEPVAAGRAPAVRAAAAAAAQLRADLAGRRTRARARCQALEAGPRRR